MIKNLPLALPAPAVKPIAKQDKKGIYRNSKGHPVKKELLSTYELVPFVEKAA